MTHLRKYLIAFAVLLLFIGVILVSNSNISEKISMPRFLVTANKQWEVSGNYSAGETVMLGIVRGERWGIIFADPTNMEVSINITVISSTNDMGVYQVWYERPAKGYEPPPGELYFPMVLKRVERLSGFCLDGDPKVSGELIVLGVVKTDSALTVRVIRESIWWAPDDPPEQLILYKEGTIEVFPYAHLLPWGLGLIIMVMTLTCMEVIASKLKKYTILQRRKSKSLKTTSFFYVLKMSKVLKL